MDECPSCDGYGCKECDQTGHIRLTCCPLKAIPGEAWRFLDYAELFAKGLPPVAGGVLDQAYMFVQYARFVWAEKNRNKAALGAFDKLE